MTKNEKEKTLRGLFEEELNRLKNKGVEITDSERLWNDEGIGKDFMMHYTSYFTDEEEQNFIDSELSKVNPFAKILGEQEIKISIPGKLEAISGKVTATQYMEAYRKRKEEREAIYLDMYRKTYDIVTRYLSLKFDEIVNQATIQNAHAIYFKRADWKGYSSQNRQAQLEKELNSIKEGTYEGSSFYCSENVGASAIVLMLKDDMERSKRIFMSPGKGHMLISNGEEFVFEYL